MSTCPCHPSLTPLADGKAPGKKVSVRIANLKLQPETVEIGVGDTIVWTNADDRDHTLVADDGSFNSGRLRVGASYSKTFTKPGKYAYGSDPSPRTRGVVVVTERK